MELEIEKYCQKRNKNNCTISKFLAEVNMIVNYWQIGKNASGIKGQYQKNILDWEVCRHVNLCVDLKSLQRLKVTS